MKICTKCVLPETFPGITFNDKGICNYCLNHKEIKKLGEEKRVYLNNFKRIARKVRGRGDYDCTLSYSGGKDSTYTLYLLKKVFKLEVLALVMDNGFISEQAFKNIRTVTEKLGVDCITFKPDFKLLKKLFSCAVDHNLYPPKTLERASTICTSCIGLAKFIFLKTALEKNIALMAWGWSPGQAPLRSAIMKINPLLFKNTQKLLKKPMNIIVGREIKRYFLSDDQFSNPEVFPYSVSPLAFMPYDEDRIVYKIKELGWRAPKDVDSNSTNCLLNSYANHVHITKYGYHPYSFEIAEMVRSGVMSRKYGLAKIKDPGNAATIKYAKKKLGIK